MKKEKEIGTWPQPSGYVPNREALCVYGLTTATTKVNATALRFELWNHVGAWTIRVIGEIRVDVCGKVAEIRVAELHFYKSSEA